MRLSGFGGLLFVTWLVALTSAPSDIFAAEAGWITDSKSGCKVWNPSPQPNETITYEGECKDNIANGHGTVTWFENGAQNGSPQTGNFVNGVLVDNSNDYVSKSFPPEEIISRTTDQFNKPDHFVMIRGKQEVQKDAYQVYYVSIDSEGKRRLKDDMTIIKLDSDRWILQVGHEMTGYSYSILQK